MSAAYAFLAVVGFLTAALQAAAALGRMTLRSWPFVQTPNNALRWIYVGGLFCASVLMLALALVS